MISKIFYKQIDKYIYKAFIKNSLHFLLFFGIFVNYNEGYTQNNGITLFNNSNKFVQVVNFDEWETDTSIVTNKILFEIGKASQKKAKYVKFLINYELNYTIFTNQLGKTLLKINIDSIQFSGDKIYKGFDISSTLLPLVFETSFKVNSNTSTNFTKEFNINIPISNIIHNEMETGVSDSTIRFDLKVDCLAKQFVFRAENEVNFKKFTDLVNKYYEADATLSKIEKDLNSVDLENTDLLPLQDFTMDDIEKDLKKLSLMNFQKNLPLIYNDPIGFINRFDTIALLSAQKRVVLDQLMSNIDYIYYKKGVTLLESKDTNQSIKYFQKSIEVNSEYVPSYYQLAIIDILQGNYENSIVRLNHILLHLSPDKIYTDMCIRQLENIYQNFLLIAKNQIGKENFNESIEKLNNAKNFCNNSKYIKCTDELNLLLAQSKYGVYNSYLTVARQALDMENLRISENLLRQAKIYQEENQSEIITSGDADIMLIKLADKYITKAIQYNQTQSYENALEMLLKANEICAILKSYVCPEKLTNELKNSRTGIYSEILKKAVQYLSKKDLKNAENELKNAEIFFEHNQGEITKSMRYDSILYSIKSLNYIAFIDSGKKELTFGLAKNALPILESADEIAKNFKIPGNYFLDSLIRVAAKPILIEQIQHGALKAWGNEIDSANLILSQSILRQNFYKLQLDCDINEWINELILRIEQQLCINKNYSYRNLIDEAIDFIRQKEFLFAENKINHAIELAENYKNCSIPVNDAKYLKIKYQAVFDYLNFSNSYSNLINAGEYSKFIQEYLSSDKFYFDNKLEELGVPKKELLVYFSSNTNCNFIAFGVHYYCEMQQYYESQQLLKRLKEEKYPIKFSKGVQEELGAAMARRDKKQNPVANPQANIYPLIGNDLYYDYLKKSYLKTWKSIKISSSLQR